MATAHTWPFGTVGTGRHYDSDPFYSSPAIAPGAVAIGSPSALTAYATPPDYGAVTYVTKGRYPPPATAELVTLWRKDRRVVMSITAGGQTQDFYMPPGRLAYLIKEVAEQLAENSLIQ